MNLEGQMLDGSRYSVPVKYWMPLLSQGGVVTQIGIHDSDHKLDKYGDKEAFKTDAVVMAVSIRQNRSFKNL